MLTDLFEYRKKAKLTQQELADLAGVSKTTIYQIENGLVVPQIDTLCLIAYALSEPTLEFIGNMIEGEAFYMRGDA